MMDDESVKPAMIRMFMRRSVPVTEARNCFGALLAEVKETNTEVFIERRGKVQAVLMSGALYRDFLILEWEQRRIDANRRFEEIEARVAARGGGDLTDDEATEMGVQAIREYRAERAIERLKKERSQGVA
jgi:prevent-host-death family protein